MPQDKVGHLGSDYCIELAISWSRQHVLEHACGLSTSLFVVWQIDSGTTAGRGISELVVDLSHPGPDVKTELTSVAQRLLSSRWPNDSQLAKTLLLAKVSQKHWLKGIRNIKTSLSPLSSSPHHNLVTCQIVGPPVPHLNNDLRVYRDTLYTLAVLFFCVSPFFVVLLLFFVCLFFSF